MKKDSRNEGIIQSGGVIQAGQVAAGRGVRLTQVINTADAALMQKGLDEVRDKLNELFQVLSVHGNSLEQPDEVVQSVGQLAEELAKERPNRLTLRALLDGIAQAVKSVGAIAGAAEALKAAIAAFS